MQYSNFKDTLQNIASQIGNVEQEVEEHKYVASTFFLLSVFRSHLCQLAVCRLRRSLIAILGVRPFGLKMKMKTCLHHDLVRSRTEA